MVTEETIVGINRTLDRVFPWSLHFTLFHAAP